MQPILMIVDDSPTIHELVNASLADDGYHLIHAIDGPSGLEMAKRDRPELILLDVDMPGMRGFEVCAKLKGDHATKCIGVVFLTGAASPEDRVRGLELDSLDYITKPFDPRELSLRVRSAWRSVRMANMLADSSSAWKGGKNATEFRGIPRLRFDQVMDARSKNPWHRGAPAQSTQSPETA